MLVGCALPASAAAVPPANDNLAAATVLTGLPVSAAPGATNLEATAEVGEPAHAGSPANNSVWSQWSPGATGTVTIDTCESAIDTVLAVCTGATMAGIDATRVASSDDSCGTGSRVSFRAVAGTTYRIAVDGYLTETGAVDLDI